MDDDGQPAQPRPISYVGFWERVAATVVDTLLLMIVTLPLFIALHGWEYLTKQFDELRFDPMAPPSLDALPKVDFNDEGVQLACAAVLYLCFWMRRSATPGKMVIGAVIVDARSGGKPTFGQWVVRFLGQLLGAFVCGLGLMWAGWDPRKQAWHDKLARTVVIHQRRGDPPPRFADDAD